MSYYFIGAISLWRGKVTCKEIVIDLLWTYGSLTISIGIEIYICRQTDILLLLFKEYNS